MSINIRNDKVIPKSISTETSSFDETVAGQEEIYPERIEENLASPGMPIFIVEDLRQGKTR